jgi:hypothetical protein
LIIGAIAALLFGSALVASPAAVLHAFGLEAHGDGILVSRDVGMLLLGLAVLDWFGRNAEGAGLRAILVANLFVQLAEFVLNAGQIAAQQLPGAAWPGAMVPAVLSLLFGLALYRTRLRNRRAGDGVLQPPPVRGSSNSLTGESRSRV